MSREDSSLEEWAVGVWGLGFRVGGWGLGGSVWGFEIEFGAVGSPVALEKLAPKVHRAPFLLVQPLQIPV